MNVYLIIIEGKCCDVDTGDSSWHGYYIIKFSSSPYSLQEDSSIDGKIISFGEMVCEGTYLFLTNVSSNYYVLQWNKSIYIIVSLRKITNGGVNTIGYGLKDIVPPFLRSISHNDYNTLSPLHIPMKEHDNIMGENN